MLKPSYISNILHSFRLTLSIMKTQWKIDISSVSINILRILPMPKMIKATFDFIILFFRIIY